MSRGIANDIRLGLNNTTGDHAFGQLSHQYLPNEVAGERGRANWQLCASERGMGILVAAGFRRFARPIVLVKGPARKGR